MVMRLFVSLLVVAQVATAFFAGKISTRVVLPPRSRLSASDGAKGPDAPNMIGEQIIELKEGLNSFQANAFESLYDKKVQWAKNGTEVAVAEPVKAEVPVVQAVVQAPAEVEVKAVEVKVEIEPEDIIDEAPVAKKRVVEPIVAAKPVAVVKPVEPVKVVEPVKAVVKAPESIVVKAPEPVKVVVKEVVKEVVKVVEAVKVVEKVEVISAPVAMKKVVPPVEVKKSGGFFGFLQSDSAVQNLANTNKPTAPPAIAKAFMTPTPAEVKKEVVEKKKTKEGLNMAMYKQDGDSEEKKAMMASRPSLADFKRDAAKAEVTEAKAKVPTGAPIVAPKAPEPAGGMFGFLNKEPAAPVVAKAAPVVTKVVPKVEEKGVPAVAKKAVVAPVIPAKPKAVTQAPAPTPAPLKRPSAPGGFFSFLTSDPSLVAPSDPNSMPTAPPAVARAFMAPTPAEARKEGQVMSAAAMKRKAEFDQDVKDEAVKSEMMAARPSIAGAKMEASKTPSKAQIREAEAKAAGKAPVAAAKPAGLFDFFSLDQAASGGDIFEPRDPNALTAKEESAFSAPPVKAVRSASFGSKFSAPAPAPVVKAPVPVVKAAAPAPVAKAPAPAGGGMFSFMNKEPAAPKAAAPVVAKVVPAVAMAKKVVAAPAPAPVVKAAAPAPAGGGMFGFLNKPAVPKAAPVAAKVAAAPVVKAPAPAAPAGGGMFGFLNPAPAAPKAAPVVAAPAPAPVKAPAPSGGMFGFLNSKPEEKKAAPVAAKVAPAVASKVVAKVVAAPVVAKKVTLAVPAPVVKAAAPSGGGMFGFLNPSPAAPKAAPVVVAKVAAPAPAPIKKAVPAPAPIIRAPAPVVKAVVKPAPVVVKAVPVVAAKKVVAAPAPAPIAKAPAPAGGGMFGFLNPAPAAPKAAPVVAAPAPAPVKAPAPSGGMFGFLNSKPEEKKAAPVAAKVAPAVAANVAAPAPAPVKKATPPAPVVAPKVVAKETSDAPAGGFFGFLNSPPPKSAPAAAKVAVAPAVVKAPLKVPALIKKPAAAMNVKFLVSISKLLKGDANKIKSFQTATDSFRAGDVSGEVYLKTLEALFGLANIESVVIPLVSELPERDAASKLKAAFDKKMFSMKKASEPVKAPFSFSFGAPKKVEAPVAVVVPPPVKKEGFSFPSFGGAPKAATPSPSSAPAVKIPAGVPAGKKTAVESQIKQLLSGSIDAKVFYKNISKDLGKPKTMEVMGDIIKSLPKPVGSKVEIVFEADK